MQALIKEKINNKLIDFRLIDGSEDLDYFSKMGYNEKSEVEQAYNGDWYIKGYAPQETEDELKQKVRDVRNEYLQYYDFTQLDDAPFTDEEKVVYAEYRQYLRDYTNTENWWLNNPKTFEEWK